MFRPKLQDAIAYFALLKPKVLDSKIEEKLGEVIIRMGFAGANTVRTALVAQLGLGQIFVSMGLITEEQLFLALREQKAARDGTRIGEILVDMGFLKEDDIQTALNLKEIGGELPVERRRQ